ncbi:MAG: PQQ-binding-like beta-propeller repeat protein [Verrucomicrobiota bacterium]
MKYILPLNLLFLAVACAYAGVSTQPPPISQRISSFGACLSDGYVYVYGGHTGEAHDHSRDNLSADFLRYPLNEPDAEWEMLPEDKAVQGTSLVGWNGLVIRVAGMYATNAPEDKAVMFSTDAVRCYDPKAKAWSDWPSLPGKVSSHDAMVMDDVLYVVGGWTLDGDGDGVWHEHGWSLNLKNRDEGWKDLPPMPAIRRAGTLAAAGGELWFVGGISDGEGLSAASFAYNPEKSSWREGPELPLNSRIKAFGCSTFSSEGKLFTSGMDGVLYSLDPAGSEWVATAVNHQRGRIFHRSVPVADGYFWTIAGASKKGHHSDIEVLPVPGEFSAKSSDTVWPSFRGGSNNELSAREMPRKWSDDSDVAWKISLPGYGQSTPVFGSGGIYVTSAILAEEPEKEAAKTEEGAAKAKAAPKGEKKKGKKGDAKDMATFMRAADGPMKTGVAVTRIDQDSGKIAWTTTAPSSTPEPKNKYRSCAAPSPCLDDKAVYAWFESGDLVAVNHEGEKLWHNNVGKENGLPKGNHGLGGSLVQDRESLYVFVDHDGPSYLLCVDKKNGETRWKVERPKRVSWSTPVVTHDAVIICSNGLVEEIDKATGEQRWVVEGLEGNTVASPLVFRDYVLAPSSENGQTQLLKRGEADEQVVWKADKNSASFASPVFAQGLIILVSKAGIASGLDWRTGEERWTFRLPEGGCWATPAVVGKYVYFFSKEGMTLVTTLTPSGLHELNSNELTFETTPVYGVIPAGDQWIIRSGGEVTAIGVQKEDS